MQKYTWDLHFRNDREYWWAKGRRELAVHLLKKHVGTLKGKSMLDLGCGPGVLLEDLKKEGANVCGIDISSSAVDFCRSRGLDVKKADVSKLPFKKKKFDGVLAIDLLEHIENENRLLKEAKRILKKDSVFLMMVPAFSILTSSRDKRLGHFRRYNKKNLEKQLTKSGFQVLKSSYFVFFFFPFWLFRVLVERIFPQKREIQTDLMLMPGLLNTVLLFILRMENFLLRFIDLPFGVSILLIGRKT